MNRVLLAVAIAATVACNAGPDVSTDLPFYDSVDFTPRWTTTTSHRIGDFALTTQTGARWTRADLDGRVHIASFIYTQCAGICPLMVERLAAVQAALGGRDDALLVSFSVTPATDTPQTLAAFGEAHGIDPRRWKLLTGDASEIYELARRSYFAEDPRLASNPAAGQFLHTEKILLVDRQGRLRGVYNGTLAREIEKLIADARRLLAGGAARLTMGNGTGVSGG